MNIWGINYVNYLAMSQEAETSQGFHDCEPNVLREARYAIGWQT